MSYKKRISNNLKHIQNENGSVSIIMCFALVVLLSFTAYVVDIGMIYAERIKLTNGIDAAALAAIAELPRSRIKATEVANNYLSSNDVDISRVTITIEDNNKEMTIRANDDVEHFFAGIFGKNSSLIDVQNKVVIGPASSVKGGIRPFAVQQFDYTYGDLVTLKEEAGDGTTGNYGVVALGGNGANVAGSNIE